MMITQEDLIPDQDQKRLVPHQDQEDLYQGQKDLRLMVISHKIVLVTNQLIHMGKFHYLLLIIVYVQWSPNVSFL